MKAVHDKNLRRREFYVHQKVWLYNSRLKLFPGKFKSRWDGPFIIDDIFDCGAILISNPKTRQQMKVNGQRLKPYVENEPLLAAISLNLRKWDITIMILSTPPLDLSADFFYFSFIFVNF